MRHAPTPAERKLWQALRNHHIGGLKFRRQVPLGPYIADFYCPSVHLVVELDGVSHIDAPGDATRDVWMNQHGLRVFDVPNREVLINLAEVVLTIEQIAHAPPPPNLGPLRGPSPQGEGEMVPLVLHHV